MIYWDRNPITGRLNNQRRIGTDALKSSAVSFSPNENSVYIITSNYPSSQDKVSVVSLNRAKRWKDFAGNTVREGTIAAHYAKTCTATDCPTNFFRDSTNGCTMPCATIVGASARTCNAGGAGGIQTVICNTGFHESGSAGINLGCTACTNQANCVANTPNTCSTTASITTKTPCTLVTDLGYFLDGDKVVCDTGFYDSGSAGHNLGCTACAYYTNVHGCIRISNRPNCYANNKWQVCKP